MRLLGAADPAEARATRAGGRVGAELARTASSPGRDYQP
jgi:hypothetical protein